MNSFELLFVAGIIGASVALLYIVIAKPIAGKAMLAAILSGALAAYTAVQIWQDGVAMFWINHTANLTGVQVWWDLVAAVIIALFFIAPRARKVGMNVPLWTLLVGTTASIGLLAMAARLFWLEDTATTETTP